MDYKEIQNDKIQAVLIKVETLQKEYEVTLQQYQEAGKNYINALQNGENTNTTNTNTPNYTALKGRTWWGTGGVSEGAVSTQQECETMCANSEKCSGAVFNPVKKYCWARTGTSSITVGTDDDYALIPTQKVALIIMKNLNDKLLSLNTQITIEMSNINPEVSQQLQNKNIKQQQLHNSYQTLLEQKLVMERQLQEYNSINEENENQTLYVNQQTMSMRIWVLIACIVILVTIKQLLGYNNPSISITIWFIILILLIVLTYSLSAPSTFAMWIIVLVSIILMKSGNLPSP